MVGISAFEPGALVAGRYRVVERLTRFAIFDRALSGVEFEYWPAVDETRGTEVWLQAAACDGVTADGATLAGAVAAIRRLNHPAVPVVLDFGEVELAEAGRELAEADAEIEDAVVLEAEAGLVRRIGYTVLAPVEGESLAAVLLRGVLVEVELMSVLAEVAEVLELLHEQELVHAHLSPYSIVLTETGVLVLDLAVALAVEAAADSGLTAAADVYALAWLACVALVGFEVIEAEFGVGFAAAAAGELAAEDVSLELVARRRRWAELNLVATYGMSAELAALLIAGLSDAQARPEADMLTAAFRGRPLGAARKRPTAAATAAVAAAAAELAAGGGIFVGAVASRSGAKAGGVTAAAGGLAESESMESVEVVETEQLAVVETGGSESGAAGYGAAVFGVGAGAGAAAGLYGAETIESAQAETVTSRRTAAAAETAAAAAAAGAAVGFGAAGLVEAGGSAGFETVTIPKAVPRAGAGATYSPTPGSGSGAGAGLGSKYTASPSSPVSPAPPRGPSGPVSPGSPSSPGRRAKKRGRAGLVLPLALALAIVLVGGVVWALIGTDEKVAPAVTANVVPTSPAAAQTTQSSSLGQVVLPTVTPSQGTAPAGTVTISPTIPEGTPPAVAPSSPKQALQQIQGLVNQSPSGLSPAASAALKGALAILQHEIGTGGSVVTGVTTLRQILVQTGFPTGLAGQINELIPFLNNSSGS